MAQFCTKCGAPLTEGMMFCTGCGATQGGPSAPTPPAVAANVPAAVPASPAPAVPVAAAPAAKSGSPVIKIVLIVVAIFVFISMLGAGACVYMVYRAKQRVSQFERQVHSSFPASVGTREVHPQPTAPVESPTPEAVPLDLGAIPIYPGATAKGEGSQISMGAGSMKVQPYTTTDSVDKVVAFYKDKLGSRAVATQTGNSALVQASGSNGMINITIGPDGDSGKTLITITSIAK